MSTAIGTPSRSEQARQALRLASQVYQDQAALKREVKARRLSASDALGDPRARSMQIGKLLNAQVRWGPQKTHHFLARLRITPTRRVNDLTERQVDLVRQALVERQLRAIAKGRGPR